MSSEVHVALLTPPGRGAVAVLRVSGNEAAQVVQSLFDPSAGRPLTEFEPGRIVFGRWRPTGEEVVVCRRCGDVVEVHCHGGTAAAAAILETLAAHGAIQRDALDDERQRLGDPLAAEALAALARATTRRTAAILLDQFLGALRRDILHALEALHAGRVAEAASGIDALLARASFGLHLAQPWRVVLAGPPNVGKSSLINAILGYERSVVFDQPGTTRDVVRAAAALEGWPVEFSDTAGLRSAGDELEAAGVRLAERQLAAADLVLLVFDVSASWTRQQADLVARLPKSVLVHNKCDLSSPSADRPAASATSAKTGQGIEALIAAIVARLLPHVPLPAAAIPFTPRQIDMLAQARAALVQDDTSAAGHALSQILR